MIVDLSNVDMRDIEHILSALRSMRDILTEKKTMLQRRLDEHSAIRTEIILCDVEILLLERVTNKLWLIFSRMRN